MSGAHHHHGHGHQHGHSHGVADRGTLTQRAALASISMALFLVAMKTYATWDTGSVAMLGSLADTTLDLIASLITLFGVRWAAMPADEEHRYGHGKAEALAALIQVILITVSAMGIIWRATDRLMSGRPTEGMELGIGVSVIAMIATFALLAYQRYVIKRTGSVAIMTDHVHYQTDVLLNVSVIAALLLLANVRRMGRGQPFGRPADGPRMAGFRARGLYCRGPGISRAGRASRPSNAHVWSAPFRPVPRLGAGRLDRNRSA
jgi:Co/Zn/Cd efflux system component